VARLQAFGPYQLVERIGVGAMGEVYRAVARRDGRVVALKRLMTSETTAEAVAMLEEEATLAKELDHPAISKLADVGQVDGVHYIAYEYVAGRDLRAIQARALRRGLAPPSSPRRDAASKEPEPAPVPLDVAVYIVLRVAEALAHAHARADRSGRPLGLVHRDVSPTNIVVSFDGAVKLLDFGIARAAGRLVRTDAGQVKGTVGYMSPEQVRGETVDARSDVYSLGVCLWELCTGRRLFDPSQSPAVTAKILAGEVPSPRDNGAPISEQLERVVRKALAQSVAERYASATEFHAELSRQASAEGLLGAPVRVARYVRSVFPEAAAEEAASGEESRHMADNKGGSDLDVFEGLAKKASRPTAPGLTPPPPSQARKSTLLGGMGPLPPPVAPPSSKSAPPPGAAAPLPPPVPPPPTSKAPGSLPPPVAPPPKSSTLPGVAGPPPSLPSAPLPPPAPPPKSSTLPGLPPPPTSAAPAAPLPPPARPPFPPAPSLAGSALPPPAPPPPTSAKTPLPPPPAPLPPPAPPPAADKEKEKAKAAVDMDWDDEEESTHVYDKAEHDLPPKPKAAKVGAAAALLASSGGAAKAASVPAPAMPPSVPPPPPPIPSTAPAADAQAARRDEPTAVRPRPVVPAAPAPAPTSGAGRMGVVLGGAALVVALAVLVFTLLPKKGAIKINVAAKNGTPVGAVDIYIDGQKKCEATPCVVADLEPGGKTIKVIAQGFPPAESNETIEAGKEKVVTVPLDNGGATPAATNATATNTGAPVLKIGGTDQEKNVHVFVDNVDKGTLPIEIKDLAPGNHKVRFEGGERYAKSEQSVDLTAGQTKDLGDIKLKVVKGQVTLDIVTSGVSVTLVRRGDKKVEKKLPESLLKSPPVKLDIDTSENWRVVATKKGFDDFTQDLTFEDGQAEKTIKVELFEIGKPAPAPGPLGGTASNDKAPPAKTAEPAGDKAPPASGSGTLNINSIPVSKVVLDGKPLGSTPKVGVSVPAGSHTVTFIHPDLGKQSVTVQVKAGETKTAAVKFKQ
jgi:serine/threonine-protein kinase